MPRVLVLNLVLKARSALEEIVVRGENWRERQRAQTLLHLDDGLYTSDVAQIVGIHAFTVSRTRRDWIADGLGSLRDSARSGAPKKITPEQLAKIVEAATAEPLTARELLARHLEGGGAKIHIRTLRAALPSSGIVWKRTRHSLKKRNEIAFRVAQVEIGRLKDQAASGEIVLAYVDEAGFSQVHPNRSTWTPTKKRHLIEANRGKRLNVLGAMISTGELFSAKLWETTTGAAFSGFLSLLHEHVGKPMTVILDNASIHKAKAERKIIEYLEGNGMKFYFLPPYSPELNRIERLWHKMKYTWMAPKCRDAKALEADIEDILSNFGTKFCFGF